MKASGIAVAVGGAIALFGSSTGTAEAQPLLFSTAWTFTILYYDAATSSDHDASKSGRVVMPVGSHWVCERAAAAMTKDGSIAAGFWCNYNDSAKAFGISAGAIAKCSAARVGADATHVDLIDSNAPTSMRVEVVCQTTPAPRH